MREAFDELWIIDLEGDQNGARKTENVFNIRTPVAIALGVRTRKTAKPKAPAKTWYARMTGTQEEKLAALLTVTTLDQLAWEECPNEWTAPLLPKGVGEYQNWPLVTDIFPWQFCGCKFERTWPISAFKETVELRWRQLLKLSGAAKARAFSEDDDRKISKQYPALNDSSKRLPPIASLSKNEKPDWISRYSFRSFDRQWCLADSRIGGRMNPNLWRAHGEKQVYLTSLLTKVLGEGSAVSATAFVPDLDCFCGRGGKDVIPLYRDADAQYPNVTKGLTELLSHECTGQDLFAYAYAILSAPDYTRIFSEELALPGPRLPLTQDRSLFQLAAKLGRKLLWYHTYGERFVPEGEAMGVVPQGKARCQQAVPGDAAHYPESFSHNDVTQTLHVGDGIFGPVAKEVFEFSVSGFFVVKSWLKYRMKEGAGRQSSELDKIRPTEWPAEFSIELLELLWVLEVTVAAFPRLNALLKDICQSPLWQDSELPKPTPKERGPIKRVVAGVEHQDQFDLEETRGIIDADDP